MKRQYRLVKLRTETVEGLKTLKSQLGIASLDSLIAQMVQQKAAYRLRLKETGWLDNREGEASESTIRKATV
jgi:hypothetical protein